MGSSASREGRMKQSDASLSGSQQSENVQDEDTQSLSESAAARHSIVQLGMQEEISSLLRSEVARLEGDIAELQNIVNKLTDENELLAAQLTDKDQLLKDKDAELLERDEVMCEVEEIVERLTDKVEYYERAEMMFQTSSDMRELGHGEEERALHEERVVQHSPIPFPPSRRDNNLASELCESEDENREGQAKEHPVKEGGSTEGEETEKVKHRTVIVGVLRESDIRKVAQGHVKEINLRRLNSDDNKTSSKSKGNSAAADEEETPILPPQLDRLIGALSTQTCMVSKLLLSDCVALRDKVLAAVLTESLLRTIGPTLAVLCLDGCGLKGQVPQGVWTYCGKLEVLDLSNNYLQGNIFGKRNPRTSVASTTDMMMMSGTMGDINCESITQLACRRRLCILRLGNNPKLSGILPNAAILGCKKLKLLDVQHTQVKGRLNQDISALSNVAALHLNSTLLDGEISNALCSLKNITVLHLANCQIGGAVPRAIGKLTKLKTFLAAGNQFTGSIPASLGLCVTLEILDLSENLLSEAIPTELGGCTELKLLNLGHNQLKGVIPKQLVQSTRLRQLLLTNNKLQGEIPPQLSKLTALRILHLDRNELSGHIPLGLGRCVKLRELCLDENRLGGYPPKELRSCTQLRQLRLLPNRLECTMTQMNQFLKHFPKLTSP
eukprot:m.39549 g.39549  ORF g.39549 m.39549 type:complete len:669 (+) comp9566_c0_seq2:147-2153(+)